MGTFQMHQLQASSVPPVVGISMISVYGVGYLVGVAMGAMNLHLLYRLFTGQLREDELVQVIETEGLADIEKALAKAITGPSPFSS